MSRITRRECCGKARELGLHGFAPKVIRHPLLCASLCLRGYQFLNKNRHGHTEPTEIAQRNQFATDF